MGQRILRVLKRAQPWRGTAPGVAHDSWYAAKERFASRVHVNMVDRSCAQDLRTPMLVSAFSVQLTAVTPTAPRQTLPLHVANL